MDIKDIESIKELCDTLDSPARIGLTNPYIALATSENTRKAYRSDIRHYENWGGQLPATPEAIARYLHHFAAQLNPRTLARRLIAIKYWHTYQQFADPTLHPAIQKTMVGILRAHGRPKEKARPLLPDELAQIHTYLKNENTLTAARDDALLQIGFFGAMRRSELVAIHNEHLTWVEEGIEILLTSTKTDPLHEGQYVAIPYGNGVLCSIAALEAWLKLSQIKNGPIFRRIQVGGALGAAALTPLSVNHILKNRAQAVGIRDIQDLSSHSLRRGFATSAAQAGAPLQAIMRSGRWKQTNTAMEYIEAHERFANHAAHCVLENFEKKY